MSKYEQFYREQADVCGEPFNEFVRFAENLEIPNARVLDLGCGQGRDALVFARLGCQVVGVDLSPTGVQQMIAAGEAEGFQIEGIVADARDYRPKGEFDVVFIDRTLHMLPVEADRLAVLKTCAAAVAKNGYVLIADEKVNMPAFRAFFENDNSEWQVIPQKNNAFHFVKLIGD